MVVSSRGLPGLELIRLRTQLTYFPTTPVVLLPELVHAVGLSMRGQVISLSETCIDTWGSASFDRSFYPINWDSEP